jgi:hypothetical protein
VAKEKTIDQLLLDSLALLPALTHCLASFSDIDLQRCHL